MTTITRPLRKLPKSVRQQIRKACEGFPTGRRVGQAVIEAGIEHQSLAGGVADGPEVADSIGAEEGLGEVPNLAGERELAVDGMGNGKALTKLGSVDGPLDILVEHSIGVVVKAPHVAAGEKQKGVSRAAKIELRHAAVVGAVEVADGHGGLGAFTGAKRRLSSQKYFGPAVCSVSVGSVVDDGFTGRQELQTRDDGELHHFVEAGTRRKLRRMIGGERAGFKLQIAGRCEHRRSGNGRPAGIGARFGDAARLRGSV